MLFDLVDEIESINFTCNKQDFPDEDFDCTKETLPDIPLGVKVHNFIRDVLHGQRAGHGQHQGCCTVQDDVIFRGQPPVTGDT